MERDEVRELGDKISKNIFTVGQLDYLQVCLNNARKRRARQQNLAPGTRVRLVNIKPKYMAGLEGEVVGGSYPKFEVELDHPPPTTRYGQKVQVPATALETI